VGPFNPSATSIAHRAKGLFDRGTAVPTANFDDFTVPEKTLVAADQI
jgi:hypothetical protein